MLIWLFHIQRHSYRKMLLCCLKRVFNNFLRIFTLWSSSQVMLSRNQSSRMPNWPEILIFFKTILLKQMSPKKGVKIIVDEQRFASEKATIFHKIFFGNGWSESKRKEIKLERYTMLLMSWLIWQASYYPSRWIISPQPDIQIYFD